MLHCCAFQFPGLHFPRYSTALLAGCAPYMAPELFPEDDMSVDNFFTPWSDIYAFGMLAFEVRDSRRLHRFFADGFNRFSRMKYRLRP